MFTDADLDGMRGTVAEAFTETATVSRTTTGSVFDATTGTYEAPTVEDTYEGPCKIRVAPRVGSDVPVGGAELRVADYDAHFPHDTDVAVGDIVTVTDSDSDEALAGLQFRVTAVGLGSWNVGRGCVLELVQ